MKPRERRVSPTAPRHRPQRRAAALRALKRHDRTRPPQPERREVTLDEQDPPDEARAPLTGCPPWCGLCSTSTAPIVPAPDRHARVGLSGLAALGGRRASAPRRAVAEHHVRHVPGLNEELGATAAWGSQLAGGCSAALRRGACHVVRQGAGPRRATDRSATATSWACVFGGALAVVGDDPAEVVDLPQRVGVSLADLHAGRARRRPGGARPRPARLRVFARLRALVRVEDRHESGRRLGSAVVGVARVTPERPEVIWEGRSTSTCPTATCSRGLARDGEPLGPRPSRPSLTPRERDQPRRGRPRGLARDRAPGSVYYDLCHALRRLGLDERELERAGVRSSSRHDLAARAGVIREFARGLDEFLVVEEKGRSSRARSRSCSTGARTLPASSASATSPASALPAELGPTRRRRPRGRGPARALVDFPRGRGLRAARRDRRAARGRCDGTARRSSAPAARTAARPRSRRTLGGAGIGCHTWRSRPEGGEIIGSPRWAARACRGSEAPVHRPPPPVPEHGRRNLPPFGLARRPAAVAAGVKSPTRSSQRRGRDDGRPGGRRRHGVPELTRWLEPEGVSRIFVTTDEPERYGGVSSPSITECATAATLEAQHELDDLDGVSILIYDQECAPSCGASASAATPPSPKERVLINERVCEGCGDCGEVELPLGPAGRDRVRPQDAHPPGLVQHGLLLPRGRLPVVPHGDPGQGPRDDGPRPPARCPSPRS